MHHAESNHRNASLAATCHQPLNGKHTRPPAVFLPEGPNVSTRTKPSFTTAQDLPNEIVDGVGPVAHRRALRLPSVLDLVGCRRSHWYALQNPSCASYDPLAPKPFKLGNSRLSPSVWWQHEVVGYLQSRADLQRSN